MNELYSNQGIDYVLEKTKKIFSEEAKKARSDEKTFQIAFLNIKEWLTDDKYIQYRHALLELIKFAETDKSFAKELYDSFWRTIPFGTGGRRWKIGIGPNRMNPYIVAMTAQGHVEYLKDQYKKELERGDVIFGAWDVRAFKKYYAETESMKKYREVIEKYCPVLKGLSSEDLSKIVGVVYAGNGITYIHPNDMRTTPWLSFAVSRFDKIENKKFVGKEEEFLNKIKNVVSGVVLSSSHNPYDNNGTKFYENSGAQAPPQIVQKLMDLGNSVKVINYYSGDDYYIKELDEIFKEAVKNGKIIILDEENLKIIDKAYINNCIEEIKNVYNFDEWNHLKKFFKKSIISFNSLNGTGVTNVIPVLEEVGFRILKNYKNDIPSWEFTEGYGNVPNPEAEKSFNSAMELGIIRSLDFLFDSGIGKLVGVIDEDYIETPIENLEKENGKNFESSEDLISYMKKSRSKFIRGLIINGNSDMLENFEKLNNICLITDPDADRIGLGMKKIEKSNNRIKIQWVSANDNDELGVVLFRNRLEKLREMAKRGELVKYIEDIRKSDGKERSMSCKYQLIVVNTVVSNPLEKVIAEKISDDILKFTGGRVSVKNITHHVGYKFTGEIIDNINKEEYNGITGEIMRKDGIKLNEAFFVLSCEEGEGGLVGYRGSVDKDSGTAGLLLSVIAAEELSKGKTMYDYLIETYKIYGYTKSYIESMVMTGDYGFRMINEKILNYLRKDVLGKIKEGEKIQWNDLVLHKGMDHFEIVKPIYGEDVEKWPQAIKESLNILEFYSEHSDGTKIKIIARPSGTEPKHKNIVMIVGNPLKDDENFEEYIEKINNLNRKMMDEVTIACYKFSDAEYNSIVLEKPLKYRIADLSYKDLKELIKIFHIIVPCEAKLGVYFPLRDYIKEVSAELNNINEINEFDKRFLEIRKKIENYLIHFKEKNGIDFIEEAVVLNLKHQIDELISSGYLNDDKIRIIFYQAMLWFGKEIGERKIRHILKEKNIVN